MSSTIPKEMVSAVMTSLALKSVLARKKRLGKKGFQAHMKDLSDKAKVARNK